MGFDVNEIISAMPNVLNLASAAQVDLGTSADIVSNIMTGFGLTAEQTDRAVDVLVETMRSANTDLNMLGDAMKYVAPVASGLGWSIEETAAAIAAMSDAGIQGSQAGTSLRAALLSLASPTGQTEKAMKKFNIEVMDANGNMKPMPELVAHISERLGGLTRAQKTAALAQLVGREAASGFIAMIDKGGPALEKHVDQLLASKGVAEEVAKVQRETLVGALKEMKSAFEELGISVGNQFLPLLKEMTGAVTGFARFLGNMNPQVIAAGSAFVAAAAGAGTLSSSIGLLLIGMRGLGPFFGPAGWLITGLSVVAGLWAANTVKQKENKEITLQQIDVGLKQARTTDDLVGRYEALREKTGMTNKEFARYLDLQTLLQKESNPEVIKKIKDEMDRLREKSGLTKEEWKELVGLNSKLIELYPDHGNQVTELGNKYVASADKIRKMNAEQRRALQMKLFDKLQSGAREYDGWLEKIKRKTKEYNNAQKEVKRTHEALNSLKDKRDKYEKAYNKAVEDGRTIEAKRYEWNLDRIDRTIELKEEELTKSQKIRDEAFKSSQAYQKKVDELNKAREQYANILLAENNINMAAGKGLSNIIKRRQEIEKTVSKLKEKLNGNYANDKVIREQLEKLYDEDAVLSDIIDTVGGVEQAQKQVNDKLKEGKKEAKETTKELNKKTKRDHKSPGVDKENRIAKDSNKELNKKSKKIHDSSEVKFALTTAQNLTKEANKKSKKPLDSSDVTKGHKIAKDLTSEANKKSTKPLNYSSINSALRAAKSLHEWLGAPVSKAVSVVETIRKKITRHQGGTVPRFHQGGINDTEAVARAQSMAQSAYADFVQQNGGLVPGLGGIDARLYGGEMVLTQFQQARLFNAINSGSIGGGGNQITPEDIDRIANRPVIVSAQFNRTEFARMIAEPVKEEHVRMAKKNLRWRGGQDRFR